MQRKIGVLALAAALALAGCSGTGDTKPGELSQAQKQQITEMKAAQGDAKAQYRLGRAMCCSAGDGPDGARENQRATEWLCRAARQGHALAQYRLGMIYAGDYRSKGWLGSLSWGDDPLARRKLAAMWFDLAMAGGVKSAAVKRLKLAKKLKPEDHAAIERMRIRWRKMPCEWNAVYNQKQQDQRVEK